MVFTVLLVGFYGKSSQKGKILRNRVNFFRKTMSTGCIFKSATVGVDLWKSSFVDVNQWKVQLGTCMLPVFFSTLYNITLDCCHQFEEQLNIEIQTIFNSQCASLFSWEIRQYFRVQFNAKQSSISKLELLSVTCIHCNLSNSAFWLFLAILPDKILICPATWTSTPTRWTIRWFLTLLKDLFWEFFGLNIFIFFVNYFCLQNKLFILMALVGS